MCESNMLCFVMPLPLDLPTLLAAYASDSCTHKIAEKIISTCDCRRVFVYYLNVSTTSVCAVIIGRSMRERKTSKHSTHINVKCSYLLIQAIKLNTNQQCNLFAAFSLNFHRLYTDELLFFGTSVLDASPFLFRICFAEQSTFLSHQN